MKTFIAQTLSIALFFAYAATVCGQQIQLNFDKFSQLVNQLAESEDSVLLEVLPSKYENILNAKTNPRTTKENWNIQFSMSRNEKMAFIVFPLRSYNQQELTSDFLFSVLNQNRRLGEMRFEITEAGFLSLAYPMKNQNLTFDQLTNALDDLLIEAARTRTIIWDLDYDAGGKPPVAGNDAPIIK